MSNTRRAGIGATAFGAAAAVAMLTAPNASALVTGISVASSDKYCANQAYTVAVDVTATSFLFSVSLSDNDTKVGDAKPSNGVATFSWTPTTTGSHTLKAVQEVISNKSTTVTVVDCTTTPGGSGSSAANPLAGLLSSLSAH
ncbi:Ig-like domain repeat protein [Nocardia seriolae]|uniref:Uncharacterized protein n=1 Tax=Nocardia seriolae TaxID=37332 RepID=A0A0B8NAG2_9NOCA|nr:Ig-like domain repeat protein [Nocardia seriolae]APB00206.1 hypothetical protein NS506_06170 [Nocardia seriolae]MTJ64883.1 hypothetical protein [Nocardia seriolae]MTJ70908.1 hypothetical protein [Nocardia seriolae]MTJ89699.1 hypothetical protein [Nocardia seriolae]MTK33674.1 hypothetical protein [Nocardia seriolae]